MSINRNHLALFRAVAHAGSFTKAAETLLISQPAISAQISTLESQLTTPLFDRLPRGIRLTAAGQLLLSYADRIAVIEHDAENALLELRGLRQGALSLGASLTVGAYLLPIYLGNFKRAFPNVQVALDIANTHEIQTRVSQAHFEMGFIEGPLEKTPNLADLVATPFARDEMVLILPPKHHLLTRKKLTLDAVLKEPLISREPGSGSRDAIERAVLSRNLPFSPALSLGSTEAIKSAVIAGLGVALVSRLSIQSELKAARLVSPKIPGLKIERQLSYITLKSRTLSPAATHFLKTLPRINTSSDPLNYDI